MQCIGQQSPSTTELGEVRGEKPRGLQLQVKVEVLQRSGFSGGVFKSNCLWQSAPLPPAPSPRGGPPSRTR